MIKECKVLADNGLNMVVLFDDIEIQMPSIKKNTKTVFVSFKQNKYTVVSESEYKKSLKVPEKKIVSRAKKEIEDCEDNLNEHEG